MKDDRLACAACGRIKRAENIIGTREILHRSIRNEKNIPRYVCKKCLVNVYNIPEWLINSLIERTQSLPNTKVVTITMRLEKTDRLFTGEWEEIEDELATLLHKRGFSGNISSSVTCNSTRIRDIEK